MDSLWTCGYIVNVVNMYIYSSLIHLFVPAQSNEYIVNVVNMYIYSSLLRLFVPAQSNGYIVNVANMYGNGIHEQHATSGTLHISLLVLCGNV